MQPHLNYAKNAISLSTTGSSVHPSLSRQQQTQTKPKRHSSVIVRNVSTDNNAAAVSTTNSFPARLAEHDNFSLQSRSDDNSAPSLPIHFNNEFLRHGPGRDFQHDWLRHLRHLQTLRKINVKSQILTKFFALYMKLNQNFQSCGPI